MAILRGGSKLYRMFGVIGNGTPPSDPVATITSENTITIDFGYSVDAEAVHSSLVWQTNYGFTIRDTSVTDIAYTIKDISTSAGDLIITVAGYIQPGREITIDFSEDVLAGYPFTTSPTKTAGGATIPDFTITATAPGSLGSVRYVSTSGSGSGNGQSEGAPWTMAQLQASSLSGVDSVLLKTGDNFLLSSELNAISEKYYGYYGTSTARPIVRMTGTGSGFVVNCRYTQNVTFCGWRVTNAGSSYQAFRMWSQNTTTTDSQRFGSHYIYNCTGTAGNWIYARDGFIQTGAEIVIEGCACVGISTGNACMFIEGEYTFPIRNTLISWCDIDGGAQGSNDCTSHHAVLNDGGGGNDGELGDSHIIRGCRYRGLAATMESAFDLTSGNGIVFENNYVISDVVSAVTNGPTFGEDGWNAYDITIRNNYFEHRAGFVGLTTVYRTRVRDTKIQNNVSWGTVTPLASGNPRNVYSAHYYASNGEYPDDLLVEANTCILEPNADPGIRKSECFFGIWGGSDAGWSGTWGTTIVRNNVVIHTRTTSGSSSSPFNIDAGGYPTANMTANGNILYRQSGDTGFWQISATNKTLAQVRTDYSWEASGQYSGTSDFGVAQDGTTIYYGRLTAADIVNEGVASTLATDILGNARNTTTPTPGAFETVL